MGLFALGVAQPLAPNHGLGVWLHKSNKFIRSAECHYLYRSRNVCDSAEESSVDSPISEL